MFWFFIILISITFILNTLSIKYGTKNIFYSRKLSKNKIEIGEEFEITTIIENRKAIPITFLRVSERLPNTLSYKFNVNLVETKNSLFHTFFMFAMPYERIKRTYKAIGKKRGGYTFREVNLTVGDFIGLKTSLKEINYLQELVVLPKKIRMEDVLIPYGKYYGDISVRRWIIDDPLMTIGIKEYTGNEPEKHIHWPSSLKTGDLMVRNFDYTTDSSVGIILNIESSKPFWADIREESIEMCISLCRDILENLEKEKVPYSLLVNSHVSSFYRENNFIHPGLGYNHFQYVLESLGRLSYGVSYPFEEFLRRINNQRYNFTSYIVVTPRLFESYLEPLERLKGKTNRLILISLEEYYLDKLDENIMVYVRGK